MTLFIGGLLGMHTFGQGNQIESDRDSMPFTCLLPRLTSVIFLPLKVEQHDGKGYENIRAYRQPPAKNNCNSRCKEQRRAAQTTPGRSSLVSRPSAIEVSCGHFSELRHVHLVWTIGNA